MEPFRHRADRTPAARRAGRTSGGARRGRNGHEGRSGHPVGDTGSAPLEAVASATCSRMYDEQSRRVRAVGIQCSTRGVRRGACRQAWCARTQWHGSCRQRAAEALGQVSPTHGASSCPCRRRLVAVAELDPSGENVEYVIDPGDELPAAGTIGLAYAVDRHAADSSSAATPPSRGQDGTYTPRERSPTAAKRGARDAR